MRAKKITVRRNFLDKWPPCEAWLELTRLFPSHPALTSGTIYALPPTLIGCIQRESPKFFTREELQFEAAVGAEGRTGFFQQHSFAYTLITNPDAKSLAESDDEWELRERKSDAMIDRMLRENMQSAGHSEREIAQYFIDEARLKEWIKSRQRSYVGWLTTYAPFHLDRDQFRRNWPRHFERAMEMQLYPTDIFANETRKNVRKRSSRHELEMRQLYQRWSIDHFVTWHLPMPMEPELLSKSLYDPEDVAKAGLTMHLPWYLERDQSLDLNKIARSRLLRDAPDHLAPWLQKPKKGWGHERFGIMLDLYVYWGLALANRYADRHSGKARQLDRAFGQFIYGIDENSDRAVTIEESIRKIRQHLNRSWRESSRLVAKRSAPR